MKMDFTGAGLQGTGGSAFPSDAYGGYKINLCAQVMPSCLPGLFFGQESYHRKRAAKLSTCERIFSLYPGTVTATLYFSSTVEHFTLCIGHIPG